MIISESGSIESERKNIPVCSSAVATWVENSIRNTSNANAVPIISVAGFRTRIAFLIDRMLYGFYGKLMALFGQAASQALHSIQS